MSGFDDVFSKRQTKEEKVLAPGWAPVIESQLECEQCYEIVTDGEYNKQNKVLRFKCTEGHRNIVNSIDLEIE